MKKGIRLLFLATVAISLMIALCGTASAAQTSFDCTVNDGLVKVQSSLQFVTQGNTAPLDKTDYYLNVLGLRGNSKITHFANLDQELDVGNNIEYTPSTPMSGIFITEEAGLAQVAKGDDLSHCYDSSVAIRVNSNVVDYESFTSASPSLIFSVDSIGLGAFDISTQEEKLIGNSSAWTQMRSSDRLAAYKGSYNLSFDFLSFGLDHP